MVRWNLRRRVVARVTEKSRPLTLRLERLEPRLCLSANPLDLNAANFGTVNSLASAASIAGYTPAQISQAYGFNQIMFGKTPGTGAGQTIAIVDAYDDPTIASDLHAFDLQFGLKDPNFTKVEQFAGSAAPAANAGWALEISLDVEWAHAMAPGANILLVEANTSSLANLLGAVEYAAAQPGVSVVSMSWGTNEFLGETQYDSVFTTPAGHTGVTFVASSGDAGAGTSWPAVSPNVLAVGGTSLTLSGSSYGSETAWSGSGGGRSSQEAEPTYQRSVESTGYRESPDVAYDANPSTGFAVYDTTGYRGWVEVGGTSAGAPQWSALLAIANQGRALAGKTALAGAQSSIYALSSADFHDITKGTNGYSATAGYDEVTGRGSPYANLVVRDLVGLANTATNATGHVVFTGTFKISGSLSQHALEGNTSGGILVSLDSASPGPNANAPTAGGIPASSPFSATFIASSSQPTFDPDTAFSWLSHSLPPAATTLATFGGSESSTDVHSLPDGWTSIGLPIGQSVAAAPERSAPAPGAADRLPGERAERFDGLRELAALPLAAWDACFAETSDAAPALPAPPPPANESSTNEPAEAAADEAHDAALAAITGLMVGGWRPLFSSPRRAGQTEDRLAAKRPAGGRRAG